MQDDEDPKGKDTNPDDVKNWVDKNPEIGKMQKEVFDDIFDTTDDDEDEERKGENFRETFVSVFYRAIKKFSYT